MSRLRSLAGSIFRRGKEFAFDDLELPLLAPARRRQLEGRLASGRPPKIAFVKQDVQEDLYCCASTESARNIIASTLMRTGPVELFRKLGADFHLVETEPDPECNVWREKWTECRWCPIEWFEAFRDQIPGRSYGQKAFAVKASDVDWGRYQIVVSVDVSVPARITRDFPNVVWCYYIREPKTSSYGKSHIRPIVGQDLFLNQQFRKVRPCLAGHEVEFPYYLQSFGCFHGLFSLPAADRGRKGTFLEHQAASSLDQEQIGALSQFGPIGSTAVPSQTRPGCYEDTGQKSQMTPEDVVTALARSKYFVKIGKGRLVWGNAAVEAIAAGCLAMGDPSVHSHGFIFGKNCAVRSFEDVLMRISAFEKDESLYQREIIRQRSLVDYLCYVRPVLELLKQAEQVARRKPSRSDS